MISQRRPLKWTLLLVCAICVFFASRPSPKAEPATGRQYRLEPPDSRWVARTLRSLSLRAKVGQLVHVRVPGRFLNDRSEEFLRLQDEIRRNQVGGLILSAGNVFESVMLLNALQQQSPLPLLVSADFERGASFRITDTTSFPWTMAIGAAGAEEYAYQQGAVTAREARALGVHWIFAPVLDVNNNPDNPVINIRSFGEDPQRVARLGAAFIRGARDNGVLTTAKHFPGHGDTATDSHIGLAVVASDAARLEAVELVPFRSAIEAGVDSIMTAHVSIPNVTGEPDIPATLSGKVLTDLLRGTLHFQGLIVTDALEMGGITGRYWTGLAAVRALQAGADALLLPRDTDVAINEVVRAIERGDLSQERIDASVEKALLLKSMLRLHRERTVPVDGVMETVADPGSRRLAQDIADAAVTLVRDRAHLLPISPLRPPQLFSLVLSSEPDTAPGSVFQAEMRRRFPGVRTAAADNRVPDELATDIINSASGADIIVCGSIVRLVSGKGTIALPDSHRKIIDRLLSTRKPLVWISFGNPYLLRLYPQVQTYMCTFSYADVSQMAAARALTGEIAVSGRMPVSIPGISGVGDGITVPRLEMILRHSAASEPSAGDRRSLAAAEQLLQGYLREQAFPGAVLIVGHRGAIALEAAVGRLDYAPESSPVTPDTIYDLASLSKAIGTTTAAMMLHESGMLLLDAPVQDYLPEFRGAGKEKVTISQLLTHSAGLPAWLPLYKEVQGYGAFMDRVFTIPLEYEPGGKTVYSDFSMILLGEALARAAGRSLSSFLAREVFEPLGLSSTMYLPPPSLLSRIAPTEDDPWRRKVVRGEVHDENAYAMGGVAGHAGLFSTGRDLAIFAQMMLNDGIYDHRRYLKAETIARFTAKQGPAESSQALGWRKPSAANWTGQVFSPSAFGHTGFTGTMIWIDPESQAFIILLSNRVHPSRKNQKIEEAREAVSRSVMNALKSVAPGP